MARLPLLWNDPNGAADQNNWGSILNAFLQVAHNADGTINLLSAGVLSGLTTNGVLYGTSASTLGTTAQGPANSVLTANAGAPSFSATPSIVSLSIIPAGGSNVGQFSATGVGGNFNIAALNGADMRFLGNATEQMRLTNGGSFTLSSAGPHAIGGATTPNYAVSFTGVFSPTNGSGVDIGANFTHTINGQVGLDARFFNFGPLFNKAASGTHVDVSTQFIQPPTISGGAATITNASTVKITGAPAGATNNYALWVASGEALFGGGSSTPAIKIANNKGIFLLDNTQATTNAAFFFADSSNNFLIGTSNSTRLLLSAGGALFTSGTRVAALDSAGNVINGNNKPLYWLDSAAGTTNLMYVIGDASNNLVFGAGNTTRMSLLQAGSASFDATFRTANGTVATAMSNLGPVGSHTTIQEWLTITINGNVRYIACF